MGADTLGEPERCRSAPWGATPLVGGVGPPESSLSEDSSGKGKGGKIKMTLAAIPAFTFRPLSSESPFSVGGSSMASSASPGGSGTPFDGPGDGWPASATGADGEVPGTPATPTIPPTPPSLPSPPTIPAAPAQPGSASQGQAMSGVARKLLSRAAGHPTLDHVAEKPAVDASCTSNLWARFGDQNSGTRWSKAAAGTPPAQHSAATAAAGEQGKRVTIGITTAKAWTTNDLATVTAGQEAIGRALLELLESLQEAADAAVVGR